MPPFRQKLQCFSPDRLFTRIARNPAHRLIDITDHHVFVKQDSFVSGFCELAHAFFAAAQRLLGIPMVGNVGDQHKRALQHTRIVKMRSKVDLDHLGFATGQLVFAGVS